MCKMPKVSTCGFNTCSLLLISVRNQPDRAKLPVCKQSKKREEAKLGCDFVGRLFVDIILYISINTLCIYTTYTYILLPWLL